jgi:general secretion pathway protein F
MRFRLDVVRGRGAPETIELDAPSLEFAQAAAARRGYTVLATQALSPGIHLPFQWLAIRRSAARFSVAVLAEQLRDLLVAGLSVIEALETLQRGSADAGRPVLQSLTASLRSGEPLSQALAASALFPSLLVSLVRASELTSNLPQALSRFLDHERRVSELRHRLVSLAIYPLMLTGVGSGVLFFLLFYVMPRFARVFEGMSGELPWSARAMVWWAGFLSSSGWLIAGLGALAAVALLAAVSMPAARERLSIRVLQWAPLRQPLRAYVLARWYRTTGMLIEGGIAMPAAVSLATDLLPPGLRAGGVAVVQALRDGKSPAQAYVDCGVATAVAEQLMRAGERTGDMGGVLTRIANFHDAEVSRTLERVMRTLEPLVMVLLGLGVGTVVVLMYLPIFELASAIQ